jgi:hypothetical protein
MGDIHGFGKHPAWNDASARDHHHGGELTLELWNKMIDEAVDLIPGDQFAARLVWMLWLHAFSLTSYKMDSGKFRKLSPL